MKNQRKGLGTAALNMLALFAGSQSAMAQTPANVANEESSWLVWAVFAGAALIICATGFMNPKRSHLN